MKIPLLINMKMPYLLAEKTSCSAELSIKKFYNLWVWSSESKESIIYLKGCYAKTVMAINVDTSNAPWSRSTLFAKIPWGWLGINFWETVPFVYVFLFITSQTNNIPYAQREGPDQPAHAHNVIWRFCIHENIELCLVLCMVKMEWMRRRLADLHCSHPAYRSFSFGSTM